MLQCISHSRFADDVITCDVSVASINAGGNRNHAAQILQYFSHLFETGAQRVLCAGGIFNQNAQIVPGQVQSLSGGSDGSRGLKQTLFAIRSPKRPGVQDKVVRA